MVEVREGDYMWHGRSKGMVKGIICGMVEVREGDYMWHGRSKGRGLYVAW